jgi:integrase
VKPFKQKKSPFWYCSFIIGGKRVIRSTGTTDRATAEKIAKEQIGRMRKCHSVSAIVSTFLDSVEKIGLEELLAVRGAVNGILESRFGRGPILVQDLAKNFANKPRLCNPTLDRFIPRFAAWLQENHKLVATLNDISSRHCQEWLESLISEGLATSTVHAAKSGLSSLFKALGPDAGIVGNPALFVKLPPAVSVGRDSFTDEQVDLLLLQADSELRPLIFLIACTGLRVKDTCLLLWRETDLVNGRLRRVQAKTGRVVDVLLPPACRRWLEGLPRTNEYVLPNHAEKYRAGRYYFVLKVNKLLRSLGISHNQAVAGRTRRTMRLGLHSLRHWYLSRLANAKVPLHVVSRAAGHSGLAITNKYLHGNAETDDLLLRALPTLDLQPIAENQP